MSEEGQSFVAGAAIVGLVMAFILIMSLCGLQESWQKDAINNNAAEWRVDAKSGEKSFVWLTAEKVNE
jgi:hypothetical protein